MSNTESTEKKIKTDDKKWTGKDIRQAVVAVALTLLFAIRKGPFLHAFLITSKYLLAYYIYGIVIVMLFIGLTKKPFKYEPTKKQMIKWILFMAAFFSVTQFIHEGFLTLTGQLPK